MGLTLVEAATVWPVSVEEAKQHCFATDTSDFDTLLARLIKAATAHAERYTGRTFAVQTWRLTLDAWPASGAIELPRGPVTDATVRYYDEAGDVQDLAPAATVLDLASDPQWIVLAEGEDWPELVDGINAVEVEFVAGYAANVPEDVRQGILMLVAHWFANREAVNVGNIVNEMPFGARALLDMHRRMVL